jgi:hypothetical protein
VGAWAPTPEAALAAGAPITVLFMVRAFFQVAAASVRAAVSVSGFVWNSIER